MNKKKLAGSITLVAVVVLMAFLYWAFREKPVQGSKEITIEVVASDGSSEVYELNTDAEFLAQAMNETEGLKYEAEEGPYGLMVVSVNEEEALFEEGAYWGFFVNDEYCNYGISEQPIEDGDVFRIVYTFSE